MEGPIQDETSTDCSKSTVEMNPTVQSNLPQDSRRTSNKMVANPTISTTNNELNKESESTDAEPLSKDSGPQNEAINDSSTLSTAFTVSFEDDEVKLKNFGLRDSIRKFAPPKPHTIEKPRPAKSEQNQDNSMASIESAPANLSKYSPAAGNRSNSSQASSKRSSSSRHSNVSDSAAFLIDKMLNTKQSDGASGSNRRVSSSQQPSRQSSAKSGTGAITKQEANETIQRDIDFWDDKSDNGTYIVGTDTESDVARKQIDELFGVVKAAEASLLAKAKISNTRLSSAAVSSSRQSRPTDKKPMSRERQEHINRLAHRKSPASRSSSSSRQENIAPRSKSRNSSCDRTPRAIGSRPRRSASQSSRQSSHREGSDADTQSSRSSIQNEQLEISGNQDNSLSSLPNMKFNRAFALRRARLGLGEPNRMSSTPNYCQDSDMLIGMTNQRRNQATGISSRTVTNSSGSSGFSRDDGGRFSLRMKDSVLANRLNSMQTSSRLNQSSGLIEGYLSKVTNNTSRGLNNNNQQTPPVDSNPTRPNRSSQHPSTPTSLPYQATEESAENTSPSRYRMLANRLYKRRQNSELLESDTDAYNNRLSYSLGMQNDDSSNFLEGRACNSSLSTATNRRNALLQLGALDSLVISAISSLSLKIRHSICDVLVEQAKKLPVENETRLIVEEILPQLTAESSRCKSPTSIEEIDQSLYFDLARTLKNLKKVEQMVDVINLISKDITTPSFNGHSVGNINKNSGGSNSNSEINSINDLSPV